MRRGSIGRLLRSPVQRAETQARAVPGRGRRFLCTHSMRRLRPGTALAGQLPGRARGVPVRRWPGAGPPHAAGGRRNRRPCPRPPPDLCCSGNGRSQKQKTRRMAGWQERMNAYLMSRRAEPVNSWRGRPILYSGSASISLSWAIQPTVRARAKMPVNRLTGMPMARCTMPE